MSKTAYQQLEARFRRLGVLSEVSSVLEWDGAVMMRPGSGAQRGETAAEMAALKHELISEAAVEGLLDEAEGQSATLNAWQVANLAVMRYQWIEATAVPAVLVSALA